VGKNKKNDNVRLSDVPSSLLSVARGVQSMKKENEDSPLAHLARWAVALLCTLDFLLL
jgi:hypothetical protein